MEKKCLFFLIISTILIIFCSQSIEAEANYANGNGTIIEIKNIGNSKWIFRKHIQNIQIGDLRYKGNLDTAIYKETNLEQKNIIGQLKFKEYIKTKQVIEEIIGDIYNIWLNIETDNIENGYVFLGKYSYENAKWNDPYFNNKWEIVDYIKVGDRTWTIRKMITDKNSVWTALDVRDNPGLTNTNIIGKIIPPLNEYGYYQMIFLDIIEATEEKDMIEKRSDLWLKINYNGIIGWIFGGYTGVERGGPKYAIPENVIFSRLGLIGP